MPAGKNSVLPLLEEAKSLLPFQGKINLQFENKRKSSMTFGVGGLFYSAENNANELHISVGEKQNAIFGV